MKSKIYNKKTGGPSRRLIKLKASPDKYHLFLTPKKCTLPQRIKPNVMIRIQILGLGNSQHRKLSDNLRSALESVGLRAKVEQVTEVDDILRYKVSSIPTILLNGQVLFENGHTPSVEELRDALSGMAATIDA